MKYEKIEEPTTLLRQIKNCEDMLLVMPDSGPDPEWFDVTIFGTSCGTFRCWLGDYYKRKDLLQKFCSADSDTHRHVRWAFGGYIYEAVFSEETGFNTRQRKAALQAHLEVLQEQLVQWYAVREVN